MSAPRIVFMGTGDIAIPSFRILFQKGLVGLITQPDKPVGRKQVLTPPRIKELALEQGIQVMQPEKASDPSFLEQLSALRPDLIVVMAYGQILSQKLLDIPRLGCINLHASLLPKYRGAACIQAAIDAGESHTGITVMHVVRKLDAGDIILQKKLPILAGETGGELHDRLADLAPATLLEALGQLVEGVATRQAQDEAAVSYISKLMREDGEIDWAMSAEQLERRVRAYHPWPGTSSSYTETTGRHKGRLKRLKIFPPVYISDLSGTPGEVLSADSELTIACGDQALTIAAVQPEGSRRMTAVEFLRGKTLEVGNKLG